MIQDRQQRAVAREREDQVARRAPRPRAVQVVLVQREVDRAAVEQPLADGRGQDGGHHADHDHGAEGRQEAELLQLQPHGGQERERGGPEEGAQRREPREQRGLSRKKTKKKKRVCSNFVSDAAKGAWGCGARGGRECVCAGVRVMALSCIQCVARA